jgi:signal transduction histidine kinase
VKLKKIFDSIAFRISVSITVVVAATTIAVGEMTLREEKRTLELELQSKARYLAELMSQSVVEPLLYEELHTIFSLLNSTVRSMESIIVYAAVYDKNGGNLVKTYKNENYRKLIHPISFKDSLDKIDIREDIKLPIYHLSMPIKVDTHGAIGFLRMCITKEPLLKTLKNVRQKLYLLGAVIIFIGIMLGLWMTRKVLRPILILNEGVKMVGDGELGVEVPVVGTGEIKELALSFNRMSGKLKELINTIKSAQEHLIRTEKLYAVGEFSAGVAHEIKNPLTSIKMLMQTVRQKKQALTNKDIKVIEEEIDRMDHIIIEFLALARPERAEKTEVNINNILEEVITITKPKIEQSAIYLEQNILSELPIINGNHDALKQVFLNIFLNSIQAMDSAGGTLSIETSTNDDNLSVIIKDTGVGIPEEDLKKIFDPFFTTKNEGTGMGLTLTHNIINDHSGKIYMDSTPGMGTTVKVELPL